MVDTSIQNGKSPGSEATPSSSQRSSSRTLGAAEGNNQHASLRSDRQNNTEGFQPLSTQVSRRSSKRQPRWWKIRWFKGMVDDVKRRLPFYLSDWTDAWDYRVVPATTYMYFAKYVEELPMLMHLLPFTSILHFWRYRFYLLQVRMLDFRYTGRQGRLRAILHAYNTAKLRQ